MLEDDCCMYVVSLSFGMLYQGIKDMRSEREKGDDDGGAGG